MRRLDKLGRERPRQIHESIVRQGLEDEAVGRFEAAFIWNAAFSAQS